MAGERFLGRLPSTQISLKWLSRNVFARCVFAFTQKFKMAAKNGGENNFWEDLPVDSAYTLWVKNFVEIALQEGTAF